MKSLGFSASQMGLIAALSIFTIVVLDVPAGVLADRWSRRGTLVISAVFAGLGAVLLGSSRAPWGYALATIVYAVFVVCSNGTYQAMIYDTLHEMGRAHDYARIMGRMYAWYCIGAGVADILSGYVAQWLGYPMAYYLTAIMAALNVLVLITLREPRFHREEQAGRVWRHLGVTMLTLLRPAAVRSLVVIFLVLIVYGTFQSDLSQLYLLLYTNSPVVLGLLWAAYAFIAALGSYVAHHFHSRTNILVFAFVVPVVLAASFNHPVSVVGFLLGVLGVMMLTLHLETRIQHEVPSNVRASVLSALSLMGRLIGIPVIAGLGLAAQVWGPFSMIQLLAVMVSGLLVFWLLVGRKNQIVKAVTS